jgi:L-amino acid N-acyltransferase YncA
MRVAMELSTHSSPTRSSLAPAAWLGLPAPLSLVIRPVLPSDRDAIQRGFEALTPDSRYNRFHAPLRSLPPWLARYLTEVDGVNHVALIGFELDGNVAGEPAGVARFVRNAAAPDTAEIAVTVADRMQRRGVARQLLRALAVEARARGVHTFTMDVLKGNRKARMFVASLGAVPCGSESSVVSYRLPVASLCAAA